MPSDVIVIVVQKNPESLNGADARRPDLQNQSRQVGRLGQRVKL